jgi:hypothetical protein
MEQKDRRKTRRAKIARSLRVRPSEPRDDNFEEVTTSINASRDGVLFSTRRNAYYPGMRLFVTYPFTSANDPMNCEYLGEVVRVDKLPNGRFAVAVHLKTSMNYSSSTPSAALSKV